MASCHRPPSTFRALADREQGFGDPASTKSMPNIRQRSGRASFSSLYRSTSAARMLFLSVRFLHIDSDRGSTKKIVDFCVLFVDFRGLIMRNSLPTAAELAILRVIWDRGPSTVREIQTQLGTETGYTTVLRTVQNWSEKGFLAPDKSAHAHVFSVIAPASETLTLLLANFLKRGFGGNTEEFLKCAQAAAELKGQTPD